MNSDNEFLLSICIPTYNNCLMLKKQIDFFLNNQLPSCCELLISNNCSTDETQMLLDSVQNQIPNLRIFNQKENIGAENNYQFLINNASGKYFLLCGDDDFYSSGAFDKICSKIKKGDITWCFIKYNYLLKDDIIIPCKVASINGYFDHGIDLFKKISMVEKNCGGEMFISANIIRRDCALKVLDCWNSSNEKAMNNMSLSLGLCLNAALNGSACISDEVLLVDNCSCSRWTKYWGKVTFRDQLATLDLVCSLNNKKLKATLPYRDILVRGSEYLFMISKMVYGYKEDNYALKWYVQNAPYYLPVDIMYCLTRCANSLLRRLIKKG